MPRRRAYAGSGASLISRRSFLGGVAAALGGLMLGGCGVTSLAAERLVVDFWNLFGGGDGARLDEMERAFRESRPEVRLNSTTLAWGAPYYTKLAMSAVGGRPPDVAILHQSRLAAYAPAGLLEPLDPQLLSEFDMGPDSFLPEVLEASRYEGEIYAIPLDTHPFVQYYNTDICKEAGLLGPDGELKPLEGPDAVIDALKRAKEVTGDLGLSFYPADDAGPWRLWYTLYGQLDGEAILSPDAREVTLDEEKALRAVEFMVALAQDAEVVRANIDYGGSVAQFLSGRAGFHWNGEWEVTTYLEADLPFSMLPFPNVFGENHVSQADRHTFVIPTQSSRDPRSMEAALEFISSMLKSSLIWAKGGHIPAYLPVANSDEYRELKPQSNYAGVADNVVIDPIAWFSGSGSTMEQRASAAFQSAMAGGISPRQAVVRLRTILQELVNIPKPI
ncbi:extracellular solute-binding protein [Rubrobacter taiwanensis]|uniref:Extracellular solute-binding protein n=1 Tax=Rubrobacter taiwanensis TaxID=185139 RepID=A0A4V2NX47_9ACTN|nr:extracellular solute-binding protein [Rubrobacter taiwanensis]TCJ19882.1 extracellular solute-binding protein [Rubrobacter taiwanensis]